MWDVWSRHDVPIRSTRCAVHFSPGAVQRATLLLAGARLQSFNNSNSKHPDGPANSSGCVDA